MENITPEIQIKLSAQVFLSVQFFFSHTAWIPLIRPIIQYQVRQAWRKIKQVKD